MEMKRAKLHYNHERNAGAAFLEFAISFPFYMMVILSIIELLYYNYQCVTAQFLVSQAAEDLSKLRLKNINGNDIAYDPIRGYTANDVRAHIIWLAQNRSRTDFGSWQGKNIDRVKRVDNADPDRKRGNEKFSSAGGVEESNVLNGRASRYGGISVCTIGSTSTLNQSVNVGGRQRNPCGWNPTPEDGDKFDTPDIGTTALRFQADRIRSGYLAAISIRYPHKPIAMFFLSPIIGALPIQAEAITRLEYP